MNYFPPHPQGESNVSLEQERVNLLHEVTKKNNFQVVAEKKGKTFSLRRQEIIYNTPEIRDVMERWPALSDAAQLSFVLSLEAV